MLTLLAFAALQAAPSLRSGGQPADTILPAWTPHRVYHADKNRWSDLEAMAAELAKADVVFLGEQHDDPGTHALQRAILEAVARRRSDVVLSMEMFERDVQPVVDRYLASELPESAFVATSRPWPRYATDYRPLVEWARAQGWPVIAANVPRPIASRVAMRGGLPALETLADSMRPWVAADRQCPTNDRYYKRFAQTMTAHPMGDEPPSAEQLAAITNSMYASQCVKDETMAEAIVRARAVAGGSPLVIHVNGAFHSDFGDGTASRVQRRLPNARIVVVSAVPMMDLDRIEPKMHRKQGDWVVYTLRP
jgi:uncharacterized iron-regulated protein